MKKIFFLVASLTAIINNCMDIPSKQKTASSAIPIYKKASPFFQIGSIPSDAPNSPMGSFTKWSHSPRAAALAKTIAFSQEKPIFNRFTPRISIPCVADQIIKENPALKGFKSAIEGRLTPEKKSKENLEFEQLVSSTESKPEIPEEEIEELSVDPTFN